MRTPGEIFSYMNTERVGEKLALFWIAWAYVAEKAQNYKLADQIFSKGTCMLVHMRFRPRVADFGQSYVSLYM